MNKNRTLALFTLLLILLAAFFLRQYKLLDFPFFSDEMFNGDIAREILRGHIAPFFPQGNGQEALYNYTMAISVVALGDGVIANRWPSVAWSMVFVALMYVYGSKLFNSRRVGVMAAGLAAALWWAAVFAHLGLRAVTLPVIMVPALMGLVMALRTSSEQRAWKAGIVGGIFAGLTAYTYTSGRGFPAVVVLFLAYAALAQRKILAKRWRVFLVYVLLMAAVSAWLYIYVRLYPEYDLRISLVQSGIAAISSYNGLMTAILDTLKMFTIRGESVWLYNILWRPVFVGPEGWLFYIGVLMCAWRLRKPEYALQLIVLAVMLVPSIVTEHPPSWTRSIGILPAILIMTVLPVEWAWGRLENLASRAVWSAGDGKNNRTPQMVGRVALPVYAALVVLLGISVYARTAFDIFVVWMNHPGVYWMSLAFYDETARYINRSPDTTPLDFNLDVYIPWRRDNLWRPVQRKEVALRWTINNALIFPDDARGLRVAFQYLAPPAPALQKAFFDPDVPIYIGPRADPTGQHPLRIYHIPRARLDEHLARARESAVFLPRTDTPINSPVKVGDELEFLGYELANPDAQPGSDLYVFTYWRVLRRPPEMAVFLHLINQDGSLVTQYDGFDVVVDDLAPGDIVVQLHVLSLPNDLANGSYRFQMGAYRRQDMKRLTLNVGAADNLLWLQAWRPGAAK